MRWRFAGENIDTRSFDGQSFVVEATIPPVILLTEEQERIRPAHRPKDASSSDSKVISCFIVTSVTTCWAAWPAVRAPWHLVDGGNGRGD